MDLATIQDRIAMAERHVAEGAAHIQRQQALLSALKRDGHKIAVAAHVLQLLEETQEIFRADRDRLIALARPLNRDPGR